MTLQTGDITPCRMTGVTLHTGDTTPCGMTGVTLHTGDTTPCRMTGVMTLHTGDATPCRMTVERVGYTLNAIISHHGHTVTVRLPSQRESSLLTNYWSESI